MSQLVEIEIAGMRVGLDIANGAMRERVRERYAAFLAGDARPHMRVRVVVTVGARFRLLRSRARSLEMYLDGNHLIYRARRDAGWVNLDRGDGLLELAPEAEVESFLGVLYAQLCLRAGGLLLSAAGVLTGSAGYVFFGGTESDKTMVAQAALERGHTVLGDAWVILRRLDATWRVFGVPFQGKRGHAPHVNAGGALTALWALTPERRNDSVALTPARAGALIAACALCVPPDPANAQRLAQIGAQLVAQVPVRELHVCRASGWWRGLDETG